MLPVPEEFQNLHLENKKKEKFQISPFFIEYLINADHAFYILQTFFF